MNVNRQLLNLAETGKQYVEEHRQLRGAHVPETDRQDKWI